jgi:predicted Zn finger-like uncharacterized protein
MHLLCPKCATSYQLDAATFGVESRSVRCARCKNVWFATAPGGEPTPVDANEEAAFREELGADAREAAAEKPPADPSTKATGAAEEPAPEAPLAGLLIAPTAPTEPAAVTAADATKDRSSTSVDAAPGSPAAEITPLLSETPMPAVDAPPLAPQASDAAGGVSHREPEDIESVAARRGPTSTVAPRRRVKPPKSRLPLLILVLVAVCSAIIGWRSDIVRHMPQMASFYGAVGLPVNLRGLVFNDVRVANETHDGVPVLTVEGMVASVVSDAVEVPRLRFSLRNATGVEVFSWTAVPTQTVLAPGATLPFRSRLASPPADVHDVQVRFFNRRDAAAGGR